MQLEWPDRLVPLPRLQLRLNLFQDCVRSDTQSCLLILAHAQYLALSHGWPPSQPRSFYLLASLKMLPCAVGFAASAAPVIIGGSDRLEMNGDNLGRRDQLSGIMIIFRT